jgi:hypothetical protein
MVRKILGALFAIPIEVSLFLDPLGASKRNTPMR